MKKVLSVTAMLLLLIIIVGCGDPAVTSENVFGGSTDLNKSAEVVTADETGVHGGYYTYWTDDNKSANNITLYDDFRYKITWVPSGNIVGGKGWGPNTGLGGANSYRHFSYSSNYNSWNSGSSYLAFYGWAWTTNWHTTWSSSFFRPVVEYYILENFTGNSPVQGGQYKGQYTVDGSQYKVYVTTRDNKPWAVSSGNGYFYQYWAVRQTKRTSGEIHFATHSAKWKQYANADSSTMWYGWQDETSFGDFYQVLGVEGNNSSGSCEVTLSPIYPYDGY